VDPRRAVAPAVQALRAYRGSAVLIASTGAAGLAAALTVAVLVSPHGVGLARLGLDPSRSSDLGLRLGAFALSPASIRQETLTHLFRLLLGVAAGVLVVSWISTLVLAAARSSARAQEIAVRRAVGASRRLLLAAELLQGGVVAGAALAVGCVLGLAGGRLAAAAWIGVLGPGGPLAGVVVAALIAAAIMLGATVPMVHARRSSRIADVEATPLALVLPVVQLGLSLTVLAAAALLQRGAGRLGPQAGVAAPDARVFEITTAAWSPPDRAAGYAALLRRLDADSIRASLSSPGALVGIAPADVVGTACGACRWGDMFLEWHTFFALHYLVSADSFRAMGIPVLAGRAFGETDGWGAPRVAVVNRTLAQRHYERGDALGKAIRIGAGADALYTVVGIVADRSPTGFGGGLEPPEAVYLSVLQHPAPDVDLLVRGGARLVDTVGRALRASLGSHAGHVGLRTEAQIRAAEAAPLRWFGAMFGAEGWVMLAVATTGTFGVMWLWVASLLGEFGVRRAVGARRRDVVRYVLARAALVAGGGVAFGSWVGLMVWDALRSAVATLPPWDPHAVLRFGLLLGAAALAGALIPARRATRAAPAALLRT
jgi:putative ABC transport system permease protein